MPALTNIILIGMKSCGKTSTGQCLARTLGRRFTDMDAAIEERHRQEKNEELSFREIFQRYGKDYFRAVETAALQALSRTNPTAQPFVLATGGGLPLAEENRVLLKQLGIVVFLDTPEEVLLPRILAGGIPAFFPYPEDPRKSLAQILSVRRPIYTAVANLTIHCGTDAPDQIAARILTKLEKQLRED